MKYEERFIWLETEPSILYWQQLCQPLMLAARETLLMLLGEQGYGNDDGGSEFEVFCFLFSLIIIFLWHVALTYQLLYK